MTVPGWIAPTVAAVAGALLLAWNLAIGVRASALPSVPRALRLLTSLCAFLVLPALVIALLAVTPPGARVLGPLAPLWPLITAAMLVQSAWALQLGRAHRALGAALLLYNTLAAWVTLTVWADGAMGPLAPWAMTPAFAWTRVAARSDASLLPWLALVFLPALAPLSAARRSLTRGVRVLVAVLAALVIGGVGFELPRAAAASSFTRDLATRGGDLRARADLAIGLRLFGELHGQPSGAVARHDVALADSLAVTAVHVTLGVDAATGPTLDSIARTLVARRDSVTLVVTLLLDDGGASSWRGRTAALERIVRRLHPEVLLPAERVPAGVAVSAWRDHLEQEAALVRRVDADVTVALAIDGATAADSALADWVLTAHPAVDALALCVGPASSPRAFDAVLNAAARWASFSNAPAAVWVLGVPSAPLATGEIAQAQMVRHALAWGAAQPYVRGIIAGDASDTRAPFALRSASGRSRAALAEVGAALRAVHDIPAAPPAPPAPRGDSLNGTRAAPPDTVIPPSP